MAWPFNQPVNRLLEVAKPLAFASRFRPENLELDTRFSGYDEKKSAPP
jgi:hypothetical protein